MCIFILDWIVFVHPLSRVRVNLAALETLIARKHEPRREAKTNSARRAEHSESAQAVRTVRLLVETKCNVSRRAEHESAHLGLCLGLLCWYPRQMAQAARRRTLNARVLGSIPCASVGYHCLGQRYTTIHWLAG